MKLVLDALAPHLPAVQDRRGGDQLPLPHTWRWNSHFGEKLFITPQGAISAQEGQLGIIPGSMGARSCIVRGKGNPESCLLMLTRRGPSHEPHGGQASLQPFRSGQADREAGVPRRTACGR